MLRATEVDLRLACFAPGIVALRKRASHETGFLVLCFLDKHGFLASSAMEEDRERRQLQFLKNLEVGLGYPDIDGEGASYNSGFFTGVIRDAIRTQDREPVFIQFRGRVLLETVPAEPVATTLYAGDEFFRVLVRAHRARKCRGLNACKRLSLVP